MECIPRTIQLQYSPPLGPTRWRCPPIPHATRARARTQHRIAVSRHPPCRAVGDRARHVALAPRPQCALSASTSTTWLAAPPLTKERRTDDSSSSSSSSCNRLLDPLPSSYTASSSRALTPRRRHCRIPPPPSSSPRI
ncbi:hypothetical protein DAI22_09g023200 [Oryza sativa Japonica Group]|uniref:Uncharacterized protein n=1 Tax=Oryza sativa subsp. japonica TaxID=39947 RepID=Q6K409_ORYSJ|nr:hypothetical protein DAI22_09g023200 [Oryza sativa Japonica Group]BAD23432.1 hypothetical protein [Oryza sativa Japonica Group]